MPNQDSQSQAASGRWMRITAVLLLHAFILLLVSFVLHNLGFGLHDYLRHANIEIPDRTFAIIRLTEISYKFMLPISCMILFTEFLMMYLLTSWKSTRNWPLSFFSQIFVVVMFVFVVYVIIWLCNPIIWQVP